MRAGLFALALIPTPGLADLRIEPADCPAEVGCITAFQLRNLAQSPSTPVMMGDALVLVGIGPGQTGTMTSLMAVDIDLSGQPSLAGITELDATQSEKLGAVEVAPDGRTYALFTVDERDHLNRNRRVTAIQFFDEQGQRQGRVGPPYVSGWPESLEGTPGDLMANHAGTNALYFAKGRMSLRFGRFLLSASIADGAMSLVETTPGTEGDGIEALANILFDPVGAQVIWAQPGLIGHYNYASDGFPTTLGLARPSAMTPPDVLGQLGAPAAVLMPNEADYARYFNGITISPDGTLLAAIRLKDASCDPDAKAFDVLVYDTASGQQVWSVTVTIEGIPRQGIVFTADNRLILTTATGDVQPPCGPSADPSAVTVTVYDPRPLP
jgi:hypothetical protein